MYAVVERFIWVTAGRLNQPLSIALASRKLLGGFAKFGCPDDEFSVLVGGLGRRALDSRTLTTAGAQVSVTPNPACSGLSEPFLTSCNYDVFATNDTTFANVSTQAAQQHAAIVTTSTTIANTPSGAIVFGAASNALLVILIAITFLFTV